MIHLVLDRRTLLLSLMGLCLAGVLVFVAGMVVAIHWYLPAYGGAMNAGVESNDTPGDTETLTRAMRPSPPTSVAAPPAVARTDGGTVTPSAPPIRVPRPPAVRVPRAQAPSSSRVAEELAFAPAYAAESEPDAFAVYDEEAALYSVQVGAFSSEFNMQSLVLELQDRGYQPYVVTIAIDGQILHTVRIGEYGSRDEAVLAANSFFEREGMAAVVREVVSSLG